MIDNIIKQYIAEELAKMIAEIHFEDTVERIVEEVLSRTTLVVNKTGEEDETS